VTTEDMAAPEPDLAPVAGPEAGPDEGPDAGPDAALDPAVGLIEDAATGRGGRISYEQFGINFIRMVLHEQRILESINRLLGEKIELGPMGAGPGRVFAKARATGWFQDTYGRAVVDEDLVYRVFLPIDVDFEIDLSVDVHQFKAKVLLPLTLRVRVEHPMTIIWEITPPQEEEVTITVETGKRRSAVLQRISGLDAELRRFLIRVIEKELDKPHVRKATRIDMLALIDTAWPVIADQFLPPEPDQKDERP
jgi:hypothetical protein